MYFSLSYINNVYDRYKKNINNTLVHRVCEIELVRYYLLSLSVDSPRYQQ